MQEDSYLKHIMDKHMSSSNEKQASSSISRTNDLLSTCNARQAPLAKSTFSSRHDPMASLQSGDVNGLRVTPSTETKKTPSPPKDFMHLVRNKLATTGRLTDKTRKELPSFHPELSSQPPPSLPSVKSLASFDSAVKRIEGAGGNRLFQTPSQSLNLDSSRLNSTMDSSMRLMKLQSSGLMEKIKAMQTAMLTSSLGQLDEDDDDEEESSPGRGLPTAIQSQVSDSSSESPASRTEIQKSSQETEIMDQEDSQDEEDKENSGKHDTIKEVNHDESVLFIEERPSKVFSIRKKFTVNSPSSQSSRCSRTKSEPLLQTTLDKYFLKKKTTISENGPSSATTHEKSASPQVSSPSSQKPKALSSPRPSSSSSEKKNNQPSLVTAAKEVKKSDFIDGNENRERESGIITEVKTASVVTKVPSPALTPSAKNLRRRSKSEANIASLSKNLDNKSRASSKDSLKSAPDDSRKGSKHMNDSHSGRNHDLKKLKINGKNYFLLSLLGQGGSARVYQVYDASTHKNFAVKVVDLTKADACIRAGYENEIALLQKLSKCKRVVRLIDFERVCSHDGQVKRLFLVMEKGDSDLANVLKQFIEKDASAPHGMRLDRHLIKHYWKEMIKAVEEIHDLDVVHSDLKPVNFITVAGKLKLIDFGIANAIDSDHTSVVKDNQIGTISYMAPEALQSRADLDSSSFSGRPASGKPMIKFNCKADIWSLGCILYNLVYGRPPFSHIASLLQKVQVICNAKYSIDFPPLDDEDLIDCLKVRK